jgi:hypothetical protein
MLDLKDGQVRLTAPEVPFDFFGDGTQLLFSWTAAGSQTAFLVLDRDGNGTIDRGSELFGNATPLSWDLLGEGAPHGFAGLAWFDSLDQGGNGDGWLSAQDAVFHNLRLWFDFNHNGVSEPSELVGLADAGVEEIELTPRLSMRRDQYGNRFRWKGRVVLIKPNGHRVVRLAYDVLLVARDLP